MAQAQPKYEEMEVLVASPEASALVPNSSLKRVGIAAGALGLAGVAAAVATQSPVFQAASVAGITSKEQMVVQNPHDQCSKTWTGKKEDDCSETQCCKVSGYSCYEKKPGTYGCLETCDPAKGWTCNMPGFIVPLSEVKSHSSLDAKLYCFTAYTKDTGSTKQSFELELLQGQYERKTSLFACDFNNVFSDVDAQVGADYPTIKVSDVEGDFHLVKRKTVGTWVNTGLFKQIWKAVAATGKVQQADWVVKVDADAVFIPHRLKGMLQGHPLTYTGIYLENCKSVQYGYFGNLEVFSAEAFNTLVANIGSCSQRIDWVKGTKWGPIGEDLFAQMCMDDNGVSKVAGFDVTTDGACPGTRKRWGEKNNKKWKPPCNLLGTPAMHPFKKPQEYFSCLDATMVFG